MQKHFFWDSILIINDMHKIICCFIKSFYATTIQNYVCILKSIMNDNIYVMNLEINGLCSNTIT